MKDSSTRVTSEFCPICLRPLKKARCTVCKELVRVQIQSQYEEINGWRCDAALFHDAIESIYRVSRDGKVGLLRIHEALDNISLPEGDPIGGEIVPVDEGVFNGHAYMVWVWPSKTAVDGKGMSPARAFKEVEKIWGAVNQRLRRGGTEPRPWEIVYVNGSWGVLSGWERVELDLTPRPGAMCAPERLFGGAVTDAAKVYVKAALYYLLASGYTPHGFLVPPSGREENCAPFDFAVASGLYSRPEERAPRGGFTKSVERSLGVVSPVSRLLQYGGAALGIGLLAGIGYGISVLLASLH